MQYETRGVEGGRGRRFYVPDAPDVASNQAATCPKCNMKLVKSAPPRPANTSSRAAIPCRPRLEKAEFQFTIFHPVTEKQVKDFNILHDMPFHLFVVSQF